MNEQPTSNATEFNALPISQTLKTVLKELNFSTLTPIQAQSIPHLLRGKDLIGQSKTGSGKTLAFSLPILEKIQVEDRKLQALIMCPTRELCTQVASEMRKLARQHAGLQVLILSGGQPIGPQLSALEKGAHIAVGTPGRLLDLIGRKKLNSKHIFCVVLDEADRMLDMGFRDDIETILRTIPQKRQTVLFSATFPESIEEISGHFQKDPISIKIEGSDATPQKIKQCYYESAADQKAQTLLEVLRLRNPQSAIVFCNFKAVTAELTKMLSKSGINADCLNGDLEQFERDRVMAKFRNGSTQVLIATDVAARGLDVQKLDAVINFELPPQPEIYVHRIGRTGRAGEKGIAISIVSSREMFKLQSIEAFTGQTVQKVKLTHPTENEPQSAPVKMETIYISGGRKQKMRPGDILGALTGDIGLKGTDVGKIEIHDNFSYVAVAKSVSYQTLQKLSNGTIKGRKFRVELVK